MIYGKTRAENLFLHQCGHQTTAWDTADVVADRPTRHGQCVALAGHHIKCTAYPTNTPIIGIKNTSINAQQGMVVSHIMALMPKPVV